MIWHSLRWRLQGWHALILTAVIAGFGFTAYRLGYSDRLRRVDEDLQMRASALASVLRPEGPPGRGGPGFGRPFDRDRPRFDGPGFDRGPGPGLGPGPGPGPGGRGEPGSPPPGLDLPMFPDVASLFDGETNSFYYVVWQRDGAIQMQSGNAPAGLEVPPRVGLAGLRPAVTRDQFRECVQFTASGRCILVGRTIATELRDLRRQGLWLGLAGVSVLALGLVVGGLVIARAIHPVEDISATAARIAAGDLSQRIRVEGGADELAKLADVLNSTFARLEAAFAQQARFTADAAHELRTPVTVLLAHTQNALASECVASEHREAFEACQRAAQRMRKLIEALLELARLDAGQKPLAAERFDLALTVHEEIELIRPLATERGVTLDTDLGALECAGDAGGIGQVITNLLANAVQFNRPGGEVRVNLRRENGSAILTVADNGPGIPESDLPHLFERFFRADRSRSRASGGTGLGLAISKAIVEAHGGTIAATGTPGGGATFTVRLPVERRTLVSTPREARTRS